MSLLNEALLTKQIWRLLTNEDALLYKCLEVKYLPNNAILESTISQKDSYIWKSIIQTKNNLSKGCCWRIGNGKSIKVWTDPCLPNQGWFKILT